MKTLKITWLSCDNCDGGNQPGSFISVTTEKDAASGFTKVIKQSVHAVALLVKSMLMATVPGLIGMRWNHD
ncbi:hypothetical protein [Citrobacter freundii]|uniref:hypothetical protein n=1 Tax=Citrobacter freundii TaxID=546 RepID=UPI00081A9E58|nr:hypothetical protein [Citrobacter freundii]ANZ87775.1 hypothetical protein CfB38_2859 [Citrobacter freundii]ANZ87846.1 hypothetical protein CfB38_2931 [Citrobacter freundii]